MVTVKSVLVFDFSDEMIKLYRHNNLEDNVGLLFQIIQAEIHLISEFYYLVLLRLKSLHRNVDKHCVDIASGK